MLFRSQISPAYNAEYICFLSYYNLYFYDDENIIKMSTDCQFTILTSKNVLFQFICVRVCIQNENLIVFNV